MWTVEQYEAIYGHDYRYLNHDPNDYGKFFMQDQQLANSGLAQWQLYDYIRYVNWKHENEDRVKHGDSNIDHSLDALKPDFSSGSAYKTPYPFDNPDNKLRGEAPKEVETEITLPTEEELQAQLAEIKKEYPNAHLTPFGIVKGAKGDGSVNATAIVEDIIIHLNTLKNVLNGK
jgi:hypothetical protein